MTINFFDKTKLRALRVELNTALAEVATKHGIAINLGNMTYDPSEVRVKMTMTAGSANGSTPVQSDDLAILSEMHGLPDNLLGRQVRLGNTIYTIRGGKMSRRKYPFTVKGPQGGLYKFTVENIRDGLV